MSWWVRVGTSRSRPSIAQGGSESPRRRSRHGPGRRPPIRSRPPPPNRSMEPVTPIVVMWGPRVADAAPAPIECDGVTLCAGTDLVSVVRAGPMILDDTAIDSVYDALDSYVRSRTIGEERRWTETPSHRRSHAGSPRWSIRRLPQPCWRLPSSLGSSQFCCRIFSDVSRCSQQR